MKLCCKLLEDIGSFGDVFEAEFTQLEETTDEGGREDAGRKLMNRLVCAETQ